MEWQDISKAFPSEAYECWKYCQRLGIMHGMTWNDWLFYTGLISRKTWSLGQYAARV